MDIQSGDLVEYDDDYTSGIYMVILTDGEWLQTDYPRMQGTMDFNSEDRAQVEKVWRQVTDQSQIVKVWLRILGH